MKKMNNKGFTIVELVIVIAVIAILAAVMIPTFSGIVAKAKSSAVQQTAVAAWKEIYARDLSDGVLDGKEDDEAITGTGITYTASQSGTTTTISFKYLDSDASISWSYDGTTWTEGTN